MVIIWIVFSVLFVCPAHGYSRQPRTSCAAGGPRVTFTPHPDGTKGHYVVEWCIPKQVNGKLWNMKVKYTQWNETLCNYYHNVSYSSGDYETHSYFDQMLIEHTGPNCTHVTCLAKDVDLVATGCFFLMNELKENNFFRTMIAYKTTHHYVVSEYPDYSYFKNKSLTVNFFDDKNTVTIIYYFNEYPITTEFTLKAHLIGSQVYDDEDLAENCTRREISVVCEVELPYGCYRYSLRWDAPWTRFGPFADREVYYSDHCHNVTRPLQIEGPPPSYEREWALGVGVPLVVVAAVGALLWFSRREAHRRGKLVLRKYWGPVEQRDPSSEGSARDEEGGAAPDDEGDEEGVAAPDDEGDEEGVAAPDDEGDEEDEGGILVLYQPEPRLAASEQPGELLRVALQLASGGPAWSLLDARTVAAMAASPHDWLQRRLRQRRVRTVTLLTPAASVLASHSHHRDETHGKAVPRVPQWGETLLPYALRLVQQGAMLAAARPGSERGQYERHYVALSEGLSAECADSVLSDVTALRRYVLPGGARALLRGAAGGGGGAAQLLPPSTDPEQVEVQPQWAPEVEAQLAPLLARLEASLRRLRARAAAQPHYLDAHRLYFE